MVRGGTREKSSGLTFMKEDSSLVSQEEKTDFSIYPKGSGESTDWLMYEEDQGGHLDKLPAALSGRYRPAV
jgi:hypothetical protein